MRYQLDRAPRRAGLHARLLPPALAVASVLLLVGCSRDGEPARAPAQGSEARSEVATSSRVTPEIWPELASPMPPDDALEQRVDALLATLSLEEKVGQVVQGDIDSITPEDLRTYRLGSVLAGGNSEPGKRYNASAAEWLALADAYHAASMDTAGGGKAIPVLLGIDAVHGHNNVIGATLFPHNIGLGAANDAELLRRIAAATAVELRATGFEWTFAPTVTVPRDDRWGRTYEGYSEDQALVSRYATAVVEGLQGAIGSAEFLGAERVLSTAKHYIGDGGTFEGRDKGDTRVSEVALRDVHGAGHIAALQAGAQSVMASFSSWNGEKMHGHRGLLTEILKGRLGFDGFVVGDWNGHGEVAGCTDKSCPDALNAGIDMYMAPDTWRDIYTNTLAQVRDGSIPMARLDDAVRRILRVKMRLGLFEAGLPSERPRGGDFDALGHPEHRALAREAVRRSLVLIKNAGGVLPIHPGKRILLAGDGADNMAKQSGGWTLTWQGTGTQREDFPNAQTVYEGFREAVTAAGGEVELAVAGDYQTRPDVAVVVFGENPYAEFIGDVPHLGYQSGKSTDLALIRRLKDDGIPVVAVFLSGRPLWVNREINAADAFVAAWLPGSEGGGVADVLLSRADGMVAHDFSGKLSFSWPRTALQTPLNSGQPDYDPLFPLGFGASYAQPVEIGSLPELSGLEGREEAATEEFFSRGAAAAGWSWWIGDSEQRGQALSVLPSADAVLSLQVSAVDHLAQEDARRVAWKGDLRGRVWLEADDVVDLRQAPADKPHLVATVRLAAPAGSTVRVALAGTPLVIDPLLAGLPAGEWVELGLPLDCYAKAGAPLGAVRRLFEMDTEGPLELSISRIALGRAQAHVLDCAAN